MRVTILGTGAFGLALSTVLVENKNEVVMWTTFEEEKIKLLANNGMLIKRPLLVGENFVLVGFREEEWRKKILL